MRVLRLLLLPALALCCLALAERPPEFTVRFHAEGNARDGDSFATAVKLGNPPRDAFIERVAMINERQITGVYPFKADDGTWGCAFKLDHDGRLNLEVVSTERRGTFLVGFLATKKGNHRLPDLTIDRTVNDGVISVPHGLTDTEIAILGKQFKLIGDVKIPQIPKEVKEKKSWNPFGKKKAPPSMPVAPEGASLPAAQ
jgi:hypothetical protein